MKQSVHYNSSTQHAICLNSWKKWNTKSSGWVKKMTGEKDGRRLVFSGFLLIIHGIMARWKSVREWWCRHEYNESTTTQIIQKHPPTAAVWLYKYITFKKNSRGKMGRCYWNNQNDTRMYVYLNISIVKVQETDEGGKNVRSDHRCIARSTKKSFLVTNMRRGTSWWLQFFSTSIFVKEMLGWWIDNPVYSSSFFFPFFLS